MNRLLQEVFECFAETIKIFINIIMAIIFFIQHLRNERYYEKLSWNTLCVNLENCRNIVK